ncbi:uncharacterized protein LOC135121715 [Zophobas morio]|uniref:uncharacterized protein LOC135121715 n=1 Tax=Zophobas morio TaxID=2755281 RepID=UPI0030829C8F
MRQTSDKSDYLSRNYVQTLSQELLDRYYSKEFARLSCKTESLVCQELLGFPFRNQLAVDPQLVTDFMRKYGKGVVELNRYSLAAGYSRAFDALDYQQVIEGFVEVKKKLYLNSKSSEDRHMLSCLNLVRFITLHHNDFEGRLLYLEKQFFCFLANCNQSLNENKEENIDRYLFSLGLSETDGQFAYAKYFYLLRSGCYRDPQCDGSLDELRRRFPRNLTKPWHRKQWDGYQRVVANIIGNNSAFAEYPYEIFKTVEDVLWLRLYLFRTGIVDTRRLCLPFNEVKRMLTENSFSSVKELFRL